MVPRYLQATDPAPTVGGAELEKCYFFVNNYNIVYLQATTPAPT